MSIAKQRPEAKDLHIWSNTEQLKDQKIIIKTYIKYLAASITLNASNWKWKHNKYGQLCRISHENQVALQVLTSILSRIICIHWNEKQFTEYNLSFEALIFAWLTLVQKSPNPLQFITILSENTKVKGHLTKLILT